MVEIRPRLDLILSISREEEALIAAVQMDCERNGEPPPRAGSSTHTSLGQSKRHSNLLSGRYIERVPCLPVQLSSPSVSHLFLSRTCLP